MGVKAKPDFSGYATKAGLRCSDGRTIMPDAFKHQDQVQVPLVWQHNHDDPANVLGHVILEHRDDGQYCHAFFNDTLTGQNAKQLVEHQDITSLSIWANQLIERSKQVFHGVIKEVSLVLGGANPGALIDYVSVIHGDEIETMADEAVIYTGLNFISHSTDGNSDDEQIDEKETSEEVISEEQVSEEETSEEVADIDVEELEAEPVTSDEAEIDTKETETTVEHSTKEIYDAMSDEEKAVVNELVGAALEHSDKDTKDKEGLNMPRNVFEDAEGTTTERHVLSHSDMANIVDTARKMGSLKDAVESYALAHGIENIDVLFPEYRSVEDTPQFLSRRVEWVTGVLNAVRHSPFTRIKSIVADITFAEARARGYIKGNMKREEWFSVSKRKTTPATIYKKQKLDRDDIIDITDFDVVMWLKMEMRLMFDEELARAILIGDGRNVDDPDKVADPAGSSEGAGVRSILNDHDLYAIKSTIDDGAEGTVIVDAITTAMQNYKGSGSPVFYSTLPIITKLLLTRDEFGHRLWKSRAELATEIGVADIVTVEVMEDEVNLIGIIVNLIDYTIGADKGGEVNFFDFFDIDYNQYKYLYESRLSGALTKVRSAVVIMRSEAGGILVAPEKPDFDSTDVSVPDTAHVIYRNGPNDDSTDVSNSIVHLDEGEEVTIYATPASGYYFGDNVHDQWTFKNNG